MTKQTSDTKFIVNSEAAASIHENGIVILHLGNGRVYAANETGARIWRGIEQQMPFNAIADEISTEYQIGRSALIFAARLDGREHPPGHSSETPPRVDVRMDVYSPDAAMAQELAIPGVPAS